MNASLIFIITGEQGEGKTTALIQVVEKLKKQNIPVHGFTPPGLWREGKRTSFDLLDVNRSEGKLLCQDSPAYGFEKTGRFYFDKETIAYGETLLRTSKDNSILVIDEIGLLETKGKVWGNVLREIINTHDHPVLITVRKQFLDRVCISFSLINPVVFSVSEDPDIIAAEIAGQFHNHYSLD
jgi:nucleoside-triphosphatase